MTTSYLYAADGDAAWGQRSGAGLTRSVGLPGGVSWTNQAGEVTWSFPGLGGHGLVTRTGTTTSGLLLWDPFGQPVDPVTFAIGTVASDDTGQVAGNTLWHQGALKPAESAGSALVVEMGVRLYVPALGPFLQVDPIEGGGANDYSWPTDPINGHDLTGEKWSIEKPAQATTKVANPASKQSRPVPRPTKPLRWGYFILSNFGAAMNVAGFVSGAISTGLAVAAITVKAPPLAVPLLGLASLAGYASTAFTTVGVLADCIAHKWDAICGLGVAGAATAAIIGIVGGPVGGILGGGIFGTITGGAMFLTSLPGAAKRPEIDWYSFESMNILQRTPYGPTTTFGRNFASVGALILGVGCTALPGLQGSPLPSVLFFGAIGLCLVGSFFFHVYRWRNVVRKAHTSSTAAGARGAFAFIQARRESSRGPSKRMHSGWLLILDDRIAVRSQRTSKRSEEFDMCADIRFKAIESVSRSETTSISYTELAITTHSGDRWLFMLAPRSGSGWHGPSEKETEFAATLIMQAVKAQ